MEIREIRDGEAPTDRLLLVISIRRMNAAIMTFDDASRVVDISVEDIQIILDLEGVVETDRFTIGDYVRPEPYPHQRFQLTQVSPQSVHPGAKSR